ncbi:MAG: DUF4432 family protein [Bifidobacterium scardovii]|uniref:DUF4432 family protein n=1 Tax=Bifidobacterium scardovii TaxID=158787 RepID=UPI0009E3864B|nr:DUF4432 family protein [Bifidobacterium scardovii]
MFGYSSRALPSDIRRLVPVQDQLFKVGHFICDQGPAAGASIVEVHNPAGISFEAYGDRCLDIGWADACGIPLAWTSSRGDIASTRYEPHGSGWVRTFPGGLLSTCGLSSTGMPSESHGISYGLHDRIGHIPADNINWRVDVDDGERFIIIEGDAVQTGLGCDTLELHRVIIASTERPILTVEDVVTNRGYRRAGHMMRHHCNFGYPIVRPGSTVDSSASIVGSRETSTHIESFPFSLEVHDHAREQVLYCRPHNESEWCTTCVTAPDGTWVSVSQQTDTWPMLVIWRDASEGVNVLGIEPSTSRDAGRDQAERDGEVLWLEPSESYRYVTRVEAGCDGRPLGWERRMFG